MNSISAVFIITKLVIQSLIAEIYIVPIQGYCSEVLPTKPRLKRQFRACNKQHLSEPYASGIMPKSAQCPFHHIGLTRERESTMLSMLSNSNSQMGNRLTLCGRAGNKASQHTQSGVAELL